MHHRITVDISQVEVKDVIETPKKENEKSLGMTINILEVTDQEGNKRSIKMLVGASHLIDIPSLDLLKAVIKADKETVESSIYDIDMEDENMDKEKV
jgi:hypothetical protein